jgi:hypothetical protein
MAPPIPRVPARQARRPARRTPADVLVGFGAVLLLAGLTAAVPAALLTVLGSPIPHSVPSLSLLTHRLDILATLKILSLVVWLAWLQLVLCVLAEVRAAVRNTGMPSRVPLAGGVQPMVHRLVTAALLLSSAATALSPAFGHPAAPQIVHQVPAVRGTAPGSAGGGPSQAPSRPGPLASQDTSGAGGGPGETQTVSAHRLRRTEKVYVVQPPEGRFHESLWEIAQNHLGDGRRYREIFELNAGRVQPDGSKLTIASLIRPGWILRMPRDARGPGIKVVTLAEHTHAAHGRDPHPARDQGRRDHGDRTASPAPSASASAAPIPSGSVSAAPGPAAAGAGRGHRRPGSHAASGQSPAGIGEPAFPCELAAASLLAAGMLSALGRRRREQLWRRAFGRRVATPAGAAAAAEVALRLGADESSARMLDTGLRYLSHSLAWQERDLPTVFAAHIGIQNLDLWVAGADRDAPAPWEAIGDGQVWRLPLAAVPGLDPDRVVRARAPYPGLVSIGTDATGRVLVDLESAHGLIAVTGPGYRVRTALAAMAAELATSRWSGPIQVTLVGFGDDLAQLAPGRVQAVPSLAEALDALEVHAGMVEESLALASAGGTPAAASLGRYPHVWTPNFLLSAVPPTAAEREQLLALAGTRSAVAAGYVIAGEVEGAAWTWEITEDGRLLADSLGLDVQAQTLPGPQQAAVADLFRTAAQPEGLVLAAPPPVAALADHLVPGSTMPVEITLLGPVDVRAPGVIEPERRALATELVVFLATHPGGVHPNVLGAAIWPRGVTREVRDAMLARVADWLGTDDIGRPHLAIDTSGRLRLGSRVRVDWQVFCALTARAEQAATSGPPGAPAAPGPGERDGLLTQALDRVGGPFLDGREPGRYAWLASDGLEYEVEARVADTAHLLCRLRLAGADPHGAMDAVRAGLRLAFYDELLWRDLLTSAHATGDEDLLRAAVGEVCARVALDEVAGMAPETEALIDDLLPSWRSAAYPD